MEREEPRLPDAGPQAQPEKVAAAPRVPVFSFRRRCAQLLGLAFLAGLLILCVTLYWRESIPVCDAQDLKNGGKRELFAGWAKPQVALLLSGQMHGYLQPCGCSEPQYGGLARRYNFLQSLKDRGWPVVLVDLGDL